MNDHAFHINLSLFRLLRILFYFYVPLLGFRVIKWIPLRPASTITINDNSYNIVLRKKNHIIYFKLENVISLFLQIFCLIHIILKIIDINYLTVLFISYIYAVCLPPFVILVSEITALAGTFDAESIYLDFNNPAMNNLSHANSLAGICDMPIR